MRFGFLGLSVGGGGRDLEDEDVAELDDTLGEQCVEFHIAPEMRHAERVHIVVLDP